MDDADHSQHSARARLEAGDPASALDLLKGRLQRQSDDAGAWALAGRCLRLLGGVNEARQAVRRALDLAPQLATAWVEAGVLERLAGRPLESAQCLREALRLAPQDAMASLELAATLARDQPAEALGLLDALPGQARRPARLLHAQLMLAAGQAQRARHAFDALLGESPDALPAIRGAYWSRVLAGERSAERRELSARLCEKEGGAEAWLNRAQEDLDAGDFTAARQAIASARQREPAHPGVAWAGFQLPDSPAPDSAAAQAAFCARWEQGLADFSARLRQGEYAGPALVDCVTYCSAFYRHYLGDEIPGQRAFGSLVESIMAGSGLAPSPPVRRGAVRRIAVVSAHLREHTVARLFLPLLEQLAGQFEFEFFSLDAREDAWSARAARLGRLRRVDGGLAALRDQVLGSAPDALLYPEVGMDARSLALAALRLAPVQIALWGHPVSPGLSTLDAVLSPDALEPPGAEAHYREPLVRLPGLGHGLRSEDLPEPMAPPIEISADEIPLLCAQTVYKLLPEQDTLFARILARLPSARLHLLADPRPSVRAWLQQRLSATLRAAGVDPDRQLRLHGFLPLPQYLGLAGCFRLNLDTLGWSGGMSALDLLAQGLPTVALPGRSMRCRQTAALLERLGLTELIARDSDDYVDKAVALAGDPARCADLSRQLLERRDRLFDDGCVAPFLADWLQRAGTQRQG